MWAVLSKILPFLPTLVEKLRPDAGKVELLKAERDLEEAKAFEHGRISPRYLARYVAVVLIVRRYGITDVSFFCPLCLRRRSRGGGGQ